MPMPMFNPLKLSTDLIYTLIVVAFCLIIYFRTKETYDLTKHKGIGYFRDAFLLFAFSHIVRFIFIVFEFSRWGFDLFHIRRMAFFPFMLLLVGYFSTMGIFYLLLSLLWKKITGSHIHAAVNIFAILLSFVAFLTMEFDVLLLLQFLLLVIAAVIGLAEKVKGKIKGKKFSRTRLLYLLILVFWVINLAFLSPRRFFPYEIDIALQAVSLIVFYMIYHKVAKWAA